MTPALIASQKHLAVFLVIFGFAFLLPGQSASAAEQAAVSHDAVAELDAEPGRFDTLITFGVPVSLSEIEALPRLGGYVIKSMGVMAPVPGAYVAGEGSTHESIKHFRELFRQTTHIDQPHLLDMRFQGKVDLSLLEALNSPIAESRLVPASAPFTPPNSRLNHGPPPAEDPIMSQDQAVQSSPQGEGTEEAVSTASDESALWAPYQGSTNAYEFEDVRIIQSHMTWSAGAIYYLATDPEPMAYEHDVKLINPGNEGIATPLGSLCLPAEQNDFWANRSDGIFFTSTFPDPYLDTDIEDACTEQDLTVGTFSPRELLPETEYETNVTVSKGDSSSSVMSVRAEYAEKSVGVDDPHLIGVFDGSVTRDPLVPKEIGRAPGCWVWLNGSNPPAAACRDTGTISTFAGTGAWGYSGDGGAAVSAQLDGNARLDTGTDGSLYVADHGNHAIRKISPSGTISTIAGQGPDFDGYSGDGGPATSALLRAPMGVDVIDDGSVFIADYGNCVIRKISADGIIATVAGNFEQPPDTTYFCPGSGGGDGGPATSAGLDEPMDVAVREDGSFFIADAGNQSIRFVDTAGVISTVLDSSDLASGPLGVGMGPDGSLYVADTYGGRVLKLDSSGAESVIYTGVCTGGSGEFCPRDVAVAADGTIYIADRYQVRRVEADGSVSTVIGNGTEGYSGDGGPGWAAQIGASLGVAVGADESIFSSDYTHSVIRKLSPTP